ncbi:ADP-ribosylglycohydrolase family protein [Eubacteriales bacterium OttesenSCG-928-G02]|nr:ADP-ribosylglycohydrolase family protein [Eubacteriales bacterium OttesenSCG-928-G02]
MEKIYSDILNRRIGERKPLPAISRESYRNKLLGAFMGRAAGCTLGAPVEGWSMLQMEEYANKLGLKDYPLTDYWPDIPNPDTPRYFIQTFKDYTKKYLNSIPCDDDIGYVLLSLFIAEEGNGLNFTLQNVADAWVKYITVAYTAEEVALNNIKAGIPIEQAGSTNNIYEEFIGADIRCDGYGYLAPCHPELAARMAFVDAFISHRENGIYGSMYFAAVISAAFALNDTKAALEEGMKYIPADCELYQGLRRSLDIWDKIGDYKSASDLVDEWYPGMHNVHTINNACLTVFALALGKKDIGKVVSNAVAMAHDNDCTAATAGSIAGACYGIEALESHWYSCFNDTVNSYFNGEKSYSITDILNRYEKLAKI